MAGSRSFIIKPLLVLVLCASFPATQLAAQTDAPPKHGLRERLEEALSRIHEQAGFPGATVGVALQGGRTVGLAVGVSDLLTLTPMKVTDLMLQGSVGKTYVAAVALQLVKEKRLGLADRISKYLQKEAWFARLPNGSETTVRMLMNHTSGIVRYEFKPAFLQDLRRNPARVWTVAERLSYVLDSEPPFAAGKGWSYSDTNYILLGTIIERITGKKLYDEIKRRLLVPLKLDHTIPSDRQELPGVIQGHAGKGNGFTDTDEVMKDGKLVFNPQLEWAGGGFASTAEDMARWARDLYEGRAFDASLMPAALEGVKARLGPGVTYGLGVMIHDTPDGRVLGHSGFFPGYLSEMRYYSQHKFAVALQVNTSDRRRMRSSPGHILDRLAVLIRSSQAR